VAMSLVLPLAGPAGEPVDLWRTLVSHGIAALPPAELDESARTFRTTLRLRAAEPRTVVVTEDRGSGGLKERSGSPPQNKRSGAARIEVLGPAPPAAVGDQVLAVVRGMLNLDEDLSGFYRMAAGDERLAWVTAGAGRMLRSQTVYEDVVKTICTTNTAWSATVRMVTALVARLGERSVGGFGAAFPTPAAMAAAPESFYRDEGRAFPTPEAMAEAGEDFYRDIVRAGYRGAYLRTLATAVAAGDIDLEVLRQASPEELPDDEVATRLLALPGVGPYAAAHVMMLLGRHSRLILDSWTRPTYARITGRKAADATILRRFRRYGRYAGLAFWLLLTRDWVTEELEATR
jgi:3-methyladenine DNA glycosylase/8-oxoguanine DNA glycosylase